MQSPSLIAGVAFATSRGALAQDSVKPPAKTFPFVGAIFGDNMVLQRGKENTIWGRSEAGDEVRIDVADKTALGVAAPDRQMGLSARQRSKGVPTGLPSFSTT